MLRTRTLGPLADRVAISWRSGVVGFVMEYSHRLGCWTGNPGGRAIDGGSTAPLLGQTLDRSENGLCDVNGMALLSHPVPNAILSMRKEPVTRRTVTVNDRRQKGYRYELVEPIGRNFDPEFRPELTPVQMLRLGVFGGKYMTDCKDEFPRSWFNGAKLATGAADRSLNYFGVNASQPLSEWRRKGWIHPADPRGWFQWYCRYYMGRRLLNEDARQIKRWKAIRRHVRQVQINCEPGDITCRRRQRQALLHWAYDSRKL